ncbi:T6SS immunity protein Tdi1 domain-containing protein [Gordonia sp. CPCC 205333]|uniref:T6SS immunity protein Tdi1 domain-containing protein n=1 Tax=Gordonia sp. CPCC 205333 TaxID=3140790 RepID=UPI003AF35271
MFEVPSTFSDFHDCELSDYKEDDLLASLFNEWRESTTNSELRYNECVGYKVPSILGGDLSVENLELTDFAVNWSLMSQISKRATELPPGTTIGQIRIDDE